MKIKKFNTQARTILSVMEENYASVAKNSSYDSENVSESEYRVYSSLLDTAVTSYCPESALAQLRHQVKAYIQNLPAEEGES